MALVLEELYIEYLLRIALLYRIESIYIEFPFGSRRFL